MNQYEYISEVMSSVHESIESWTRDLLRHAGIETIEVYGQFPPEGSIASHIVVFPYRLSGADSQMQLHTKVLMGSRWWFATWNASNVGTARQAIYPVCMEKYPKLVRHGKPHQLTSQISSQALTSGTNTRR